MFINPDLRTVLALAFTMANLWVLAQNGAEIYPFLNTPVSARQAALGGDAISVRDHDAGMMPANPALMNLEMDGKISLQYASYLANTGYGTLSFVKDLQYGHLGGIYARFMDYGEIPRTDESGNTSGDFRASDAVIGLSYAYQFEDNWTVGGGIGFVTSKIDSYTSMAVTGTASVNYHLSDRVQDKQVLALTARNFGYQFKTYNGKRERLPLQIDLGYTHIFTDYPLALTVTAHDLQKFNISNGYNRSGREIAFGRKLADHFSIGAEFFPEQAFNLRLGYNMKRGSELSVEEQRSFAGLSAGFGIKIGAFRFDYAHVRYHNASNSNMLGLMLDIK